MTKFHFDFFFFFLINIWMEPAGVCVGKGKGGGGGGGSHPSWPVLRKCAFTYIFQFAFMYPTEDLFILIFFI